MNNCWQLPKVSLQELLLMWTNSTGWQTKYLQGIFSSQWTVGSAPGGTLRGEKLCVVLFHHLQGQLRG